MKGFIRLSQHGRGCGMSMWCDNALCALSLYFHLFRVSRVVLAWIVFPVVVYNWQRQCDFGYIAYVSARTIVEWLENDSSASVSRCIIGHINGHSIAGLERPYCAGKKENHGVIKPSAELRGHFLRRSRSASCIVHFAGSIRLHITWRH